MHPCRLLPVLPLLVALTAPGFAESPSPAPSYPAVPLLSTSTTILGEKIHYPTGDAHVTASIVTLAPGARTILHTHAVPLFAYILEGELTVDYGAHGRRTYKQGQSLVEAMAVPHYGINTGNTVMRLIGVYMGADGVKDVTPVK
ncbi:MAG: cupin domain-containing protein [Rhodopseudomonas sp.]|nr:cupin domain-containing protein [Rhodopseudomonas sp.]